MMICENPKCDKEKEMDFNMPFYIGLFTADVCMDCGFQLHENPIMLQSILTERGKARGIKFPISLDTEEGAETFKMLCKKGEPK